MRSLGSPFLVACLLGHLCGIAYGDQAVARGSRRPNVLILMADDHRGDIMGCAGDPIVSTPNLDRLAAEGTRFTRFASQSPVCIPTRATIMTGWYQKTHQFDLGPPIDFDTPYFAEIFADAGYTTGYAGKWHLNGSPFAATKDQAYVPPDRRLGFQEWDAYDTGIDHDRATTFDETQDPPVLVEVPGYDWADSYYSDVFLDFANRHASDANPWMYYLSYAHPHQPEEAPQEFLDMYPLASIDPYRFAPELRGRISALDEAAFQRTLQYYYAEVSFLDSEIGHVLDGLDAAGLADDTIVVYFSDHGQLLGSHLFEAMNLLSAGIRQAFRAKALPFSAAIRAPWIIRWPGHVVEGAEIDALASTVDFTPTVLDLAGLAVPYQMQGTSMRRWCEGREGPSAEALYLSRDTARLSWEAVWNGDYLYCPSVGVQALYDLTIDSREQVNVFGDAAYAGVRQAMQDILDELAVVAATVPSPPANSSGGGSNACFIATAAYGTPLAKELDTLRSFRDRRLLTTYSGAVFSDVYYHASPNVALWISDRPGAARAVRVLVSALLFVLQRPDLIAVVLAGVGTSLFAYSRSRRCPR